MYNQIAAVVILGWAIVGGGLGILLCLKYPGQRQRIERYLQAAEAGIILGAGLVMLVIAGGAAWAAGNPGATLGAGLCGYIAALIIWVWDLDDIGGLDQRGLNALVWGLPPGVVFALLAQGVSPNLGLGILLGMYGLNVLVLAVAYGVGVNRFMGVRDVG